MMCMILFCQDLQSVFGILSAILNIGDVKFSLQDEKTGVYVENLDLLDKGMF